MIGTTNLYTMDHFRLDGNRLELVYTPTGFEYSMAPTVRPLLREPEEGSEQQALSLLSEGLENTEVVLSVKKVSTENDAKAWGTYGNAEEGISKSLSLSLFSLLSSSSS